MHLAPGPVESLEVFVTSDTMALIHWNEPAQPNGVLVEYRVKIVGNGVFVDDIAVSSAETALEIFNLGN